MKEVKALDPVSHTEQDWQSARAVLGCNRYMLENEIECDVHFTLVTPGGDTVRMHAHTYVLISRSPVFFAMFIGPLAEQNRDIKVTDISPDAFQQLLRFLYYEAVDLSPDLVFPVLYAAKKYFVTSLTKVCFQYLTSILTEENACVYLENIFLFEEEEELTAKCWDIVRHRTRAVFRTESFYEISKETLCKLLAVDSLSLQEVEVFRACVLWADRQCSAEGKEATPANKRAALGPALRLIHIPSLSLTEFTKTVVPTGILTTEEENLIFRFLLQKSEASGQPTTFVDEFPFPTRSRERVAITCRIQYGGFIKHTTSYSSLFHGLPQRSKWHLTFAIDHTIRLTEIGFTGKFKGTVAVLQNGTRKLEAACHDHVETIVLNEEEKVTLDAGLFTITSESPFSFIGDYFSRSVSQGDAVVPSGECDPAKVNLFVKEGTTLSFLHHLIFVPTDDMLFVENYFGEE